MKLNIKKLIVLILLCIPVLLLINACTKENAGNISLTQQDLTEKNTETVSVISEEAKFQQWKNEIGYNKVPQTDCLQPGGTGPYDPTDCLKSLIDDMLDLSKKAKGNTEILSIITNESVELNQILKAWQALSPKEKLRRQAITSSLQKDVGANSNDFKKGLASFIQKTQDKQSIAFAQSALKDNRRFCVPLQCVCVGPYPCPCCDWFVWTSVIVF